MTREEEVQYEQDNLGNERKKLDTLRAQEGLSGSSSDDEGIVSVGSGDTSNDLVAMTQPAHADQMILDEIQAYKSGSGISTFKIKEAPVDDQGNIGATTDRTVPITVDGENTRIIDYNGKPFEDDIVVNSKFAGDIGVGVIVDHKESTESNLST